MYIAVPVYLFVKSCAFGGDFVNCLLKTICLGLSAFANAADWSTSASSASLILTPLGYVLPIFYASKEENNGIILELLEFIWCWTHFQLKKKHQLKMRFGWSHWVDMVSGINVGGFKCQID